MGKPYSKDLRGRFVALLEAGASASGAGKQLLIARSTATRWGAIWTTEKRCEALPMGGDRRSGELEKHSAFILSRVEEKPDIFLHEIVAELALRDVIASENAVCRLLFRHGITRNKRPSSPPSGSSRMSRRRGWSGSTP